MLNIVSGGASYWFFEVYILQDATTSATPRRLVSTGNQPLMITPIRLSAQIDSLFLSILGGLLNS